MPPTSSASSPDLERQQLVLPLRQGCEELGLAVSESQLERLLDYLELLARWNRAYNLTAVRDSALMVTRHLLDSLSVSDHLAGKRVLDVGSGAGLPGVPLAITQPQREFHLLDSNGKKTRFLFQVKTTLRLDNMAVHHARVESFRAEPPYDVIVSRAFAALGDMVRSCRHLLAPGGRILAMKGACTAAELESVSGAGARARVLPLAVPGLAEQRHLVEIHLDQDAARQ